MRVLAFLLLCALPATAAAQTADQTLLPILNRLSTYERDLRDLNNTVERLRRQVDGLELRIEALEKAAAEKPAETPAPDADAAAPPVAVQGETGAQPPGALPQGNALELYKQGRNLLLQARLPEAEQVFTAFLDDFPAHELANNARHWLATSFAGQGKHDAAAQQFLLAYEKDPDGPKAPDNLLKLGRAFAALGKEEEACIALSRLSRKHKQAPSAVIAAADAERRRLKC